MRRALLVARLEGRLDDGDDLATGERGDRELVHLVMPVRESPQIVDDRLADLDRRLADRVEKNRRDRAATPRPLPIHVLVERAGLDDFAFDLFLLALAPEIDDLFTHVLG